MGITVLPNCLFQEEQTQGDDKRKRLGDVAEVGKYYRHPDSSQISYPLVVENPLGTINQPLNIAIIGCGGAGIAALYELSNLANSKKNISVTLYESDPENFIHESKSAILNMRSLRAGRITAAVKSVKEGKADHAVYEIGAMRFPEIAGLMWHYVNILYGADYKVGPFPNPGTIPTELVHGDRVERFGNGQWLDPDSPTKKVVEIIKNGLYGQTEGNNTSLFLIGGEDPAKISVKLTSKETTNEELAAINEEWEIFTDKYDTRTLECAIREVIADGLDQLPKVPGLQNSTDKINYYVELFGTVGFGTGGFRSIYSMSLLEMMRLLIWNYSNDYTLPVPANVYFIRDLYKEAVKKNPNVQVKLARVCDVCHLDGNPEGATLVVYYDITEDAVEDKTPKVGIYDYVILATTPRPTSTMISRLGFENVPRKEVLLGDYGRQLSHEQYVGSVRPALVLSNEFEAANYKIYSALKQVHMASSSKVYATIEKSKFDCNAPEFLNQGKIKAVVSDCGLGTSLVVPTSLLNAGNEDLYKDFYSFLVSYTWEDDTKRLQHHFGKFPMNIDQTERMMNAIVNRTVRYVKDPEDGTMKSWWFGKALGQNTIEHALSYDWTTFHSSGAFKLDNTGDHYNTHLLFRYHTHALNPELKNRFFLANCSYSHLGGWLEGAFMSAVNAVCGLIVAANDGNVNALSPEARKVIGSLDKIVEN